MSEKKERTVLLIGGSGHGKSFFLNMFEQVAVHSYLGQAVENCGQFLIPVKFFHRKECVSEAIDDVDKRSGAKSLTPVPTIYEYPTNYGVLRLIDTPGTGDTGGSDCDQKHLTNVISCMGKFEQIHAILLFFKNSDNRFDFKAKYQLCELLSFLGKSAVDNIHFVITHAGSHHDTGDVGCVIEDFNKLLPVQIPFSDENTFCFENDPLKYIILKKQGKSGYSSASQNIFNFTYNTTRNEYIRLFKKVCSCETPYDVREYRALAMARQLWPKLSLHFSEVDAVKNVLAAEECYDTKALLEMVAELELNLEKTKSVFDSAVDSFLYIASGSTVAGLAGVAANRSHLALAGGTAAGAAMGEAVSFAGSAFTVASGPAIAVGGALGALFVAGALTVNHFNTRHRREGIIEKLEEAKTSAAKAEEYERFLEEKSRMKLLEEDFARCLHHNAILGYTVAKEEYVKNEMTCVDSYQETQRLEEKLEQLIREKAIFEQVLENDDEERHLLSPQELLNDVSSLCDLTYYGKPLQRAIEQCQVINAAEFDVFERTEVAKGSFFGEIF